MRIVSYLDKYGGFINALREDGHVDEDVNSGNRAGDELSILFQPTPDISITPRLWLTTSFTTNYDEATVNSFIDGMVRAQSAATRFPL